MHLGLVVYGDLSNKTGGFLYDRHIVSALQADGNKVSVFSFPWRRYLPHLLDNFSRKLEDWLELVKPDLLIQDELVHPSLFRMNYRLRRTFGRPVISIVHHLRCSEQNTSALIPLYRSIERSYLNSVDGFIANSMTTLESIEQLLGRSAPSVVAYPGRDHIRASISPAEIEKRALSTESCQLLFLGSIIRRKGLDTLLDALVDVENDFWHLDIVGDAMIDPRYTSYLKRKIIRGDMTMNITWHGLLPEDRLEQIWKNTHVLVVPSQYEGFGIVYLEAMAHGVVPIGSAAGGASELIKDNENGFLVSPGDSTTLRARLQLLANNRDTLSSLASKGLQRYAEHPTWGASAEKIQSYLEVRI